MPSDETDDLIRELKSGDVSQILTDEEEVADTSPDVVRTAFDVPKVIQRVLESKRREELMGVARFLDPDNQKKLTLVFHTEIGDVKCPVNWSSNKPDRLSQADGLLLIQVRTSEVMFSPKPGADLQISFEGYPGRVRVTSLSEPQELYPGIDLLCFLPHNALMEKQGVVKDGAPSVVSGAPSDHVDEAGEPVAGQEKSAFAARNVEFDEPGGKEVFDSPEFRKAYEEGLKEDFDKPREG